jgi:hypothetical protein
MNTPTTITPLQAWLRSATVSEQQTLAERTGTSAQYLRHLAASEDKAYKRVAKAALAAAIERETKAMAKASKGRLPVVRRTDLNSTCRQCEFARKCLGDAVVTAGEFPIVDSRQLTLGL